MDAWHLYIITNCVNGKCYIGLTHNPLNRWSRHRNGHGSKLVKAAIAKYGIANLEFKVLCIASKEYIQQLEIAAISAYRTLTPDGYNLSTGGESGASGVKMPRESVLRGARKRKGFRQTEEVCRRISQAHRGKKLTREHRNKLSKSHQGKLMHPATREAMKTTNSRAIRINGVYYPSILRAAIVLGINKNRLYALMAGYRRKGVFPKGWGYE